MGDELKEARCNTNGLYSYVTQTPMDKDTVQKFLQFLDRRDIHCFANPDARYAANLIYVRQEDLAVVRMYDAKFGKRLLEAGKGNSSWQDDADALIDLVNSGVTL